MSLLFTAFGRFDGGPNCSERLFGRFAADPAPLEAAWGAPVTLALLPVDPDTADDELARALDRAKPTHVLLTGQAAGRTEISFERVARNRLDVTVPDAHGRTGLSGEVAPGGAAELRATWPGLERLAAALRADGLPAKTSDDAGAHLCNQTLYLALRAATRRRPSFVTTFLHLPLLPEQVEAQIPAAARHENCFAMPLDDMERAVGRVLVHTRRIEAEDA